MSGLSDPALPGAVALSIQARLAAQLPGTDPTGTQSLAIIVDEIYKAICSNAIVSPLTGLVPTLLSAAAGSPVTGTGSIK